MPSSYASPWENTIPCGLLPRAVRRFIPYFVSVARSADPNTRNDYLASLFLKGLLIRGLARRVASRRVVIAQWEGRLESWWSLLTTLSEWGEGVKVVSFLKIRSFPNEHGAPLGSRFPDVAIVPEGRWLAGIIGSDWARPLSHYERNLAECILGKGWDQGVAQRLVASARGWPRFARAAQLIGAPAVIEPRQRLRECVREVQRDLVAGWRP
jgi:hypothetical protein